MKTLITLFIFVCSFSVPALADFEFYRGVRQMGMGGASIAVVNDETSLLLNPNGLGRLRNHFFTPFDPEITGSSTGTSTLLGTGVMNSVNPNDTYNQLSGQTGEPYYFKGQVFPSIVVPNFGIGALGRYEVLARRNADGSYDYNYQNDYSLNVGYNMSFWGGRIKWGVAGRMINRVEYFGTRASTDSLALSSFATEGTGIAVDSALTLAAPWQWIPTLAVMVHNLGNTSFTASDGFFGNHANGTPQTMNQSVDAAVALFPIYANHTRGVMTVEYTGIMNTTGVTDPMNRLHIGTELNLWDAYFLRAGYHANRWTAGFEYAFGLMQFQAATYAEKVTFGTFSDYDRRVVLKFAVRF